MRAHGIRSRILAFLFACAVLPLASCSSGGDGGNYEQADLTGHWFITSVYAGSQVASGTATAWIRGRISVDSSGDASVVWTEDSSGGAPNPPVAIRYTIDGSGTVTAPAFLDFSGKMSPAKDLVASTLNNFSAAPRPNLRIYQKLAPGTSFTAADPTSATFDYHLLRVGADAGWEHGTAVTDASRVMSLVSRSTDAGAAPDLPQMATLSVDADGVVTAPENGSFKGFLSADKALLVLTMAVSVNPPVHALVIATRHAGSYGLADLGGEWMLHGFLVGPAGEVGWGRGPLSVSSTGRLAFSSWLDSGGNTIPPDAATVAVDTHGVVTTPGLPGSTFHGQIAPGKQFMVATSTDDVGLGSLYVVVR